MLLVQATESAQSKKLIPDLSTWAQCFAIYAAVVLSAQPHRATSMILYMYHIAKLSKQFQWPSWIIYDHEFRELAAATGNQDWSKIEPSVYTTSFTNQMVKSPGWCAPCKTMQHSQENCPIQSQAQKRRYASASPSPKRPKAPGSVPVPCREWNRRDQSCSYGEACRFLHVCARCRKPDHTVRNCTSKKTQ